MYDELEKNFNFIKIKCFLTLRVFKRFEFELCSVHENILFNKLIFKLLVKLYINDILKYTHKIALISSLYFKV